MQTWWEMFSGPIGGWRSALLWRLFGVFVNQIFLLLHAWTRSWSDLGARPLSFYTTHLCGLLLVLLGPRLWLLLVTAASGGVFVWRHVIPDPIYQLAEEFLPLVALPAMGALLVVLCRRGDAARDEAAQVSLFRVSVLVVMAFAAFHKLNADFFDPSVSCAIIVPERILAVLPLADWVRWLLPFAGFLGEALVPVLLVLWPRVGMPFALVIMSVIGHRGATPFTMLVMVMALAFLRDGDRTALVEGWRRHWPRLAVLAALASGASFAVYFAFGTHRPWREFLSFELVILGIGFSLFWVLLPGARGASLRDWRTLGFRTDPIWCRDRPVRIALAVLVVAGVANGVTPYLGAKFRRSFAMFSNLRVDDGRWNHLFVPRAVFQRDFDPYVHVERVEPRDEKLVPSVLTPDGLDERLLALRRRRRNVAVSLRHAGQTLRFERAATNSELAAWLGALPVSSRLFQDGLTKDGPQRCLH
ncbi:MAG: hypothetical protein MJE66_06285 [Proteobacteria bacterium]|nr:hypothetical protein [Pseudomonadota bacterium]